MTTNMNNSNSTIRNLIPAFRALLHRKAVEETTDSSIREPNIIPAHPMYVAETKWAGWCKNCLVSDEKRIALRRCFHYLAALKLFGTGIPVSAIRMLTGNDEIINAVHDDGNVDFRVHDERLVLTTRGLTHDEIIDYVNANEGNVQMCLVDYINTVGKDEKAVLSFEKTVMSQSTLFNPKKAEIVNAAEFVELYLGRPDYLEILSKNDRIHSLLIAKANIQILKMNPEDEMFQERASEAVSESFSNFTAYSENKPEYRNIVWIKYLSVAENYTVIIPQTLLDFITDETYRSATTLLKTHVMSVRKQAPGTQRAENVTEYELSVYKKILSEIDNADIPACLRLGNLLQEKGDFAGARGFFRRVCKQDAAGINGVTALLTAYQKEIKALFNERHYAEDVREIDEKIRSINVEMEKLFRSNETKLLNRIMVATGETCEALEKDYIALIAKHARYEKDRGNYETAYHLLLDVPETYQNYHRIVAELGLFYQTTGNRRMVNVRADIDKAIEMLKRAYSMLDDKASDYERKSILIPLANSYFNKRDFDSAKAVCSLILKLDRNEVKAKALLDQMRMPGRDGDAA